MKFASAENSPSIYGVETRVLNHAVRRNEEMREDLAVMPPFSSASPKSTIGEHTASCERKDGSSIS
jgi:hypothetical protein